MYEIAERTRTVSRRKGERKMENASMLEFHADDIILKEGGTYEEMYKIISGSVAVYIRYDSLSDS